jgi:PAS domain S-box-containing protein
MSRSAAPRTAHKLGKKAAARVVREAAGHEPLSPADAERVVQQLQVHQLELEMQNKELRKAQLELEASRDRFSDLYDHAPVGYLTLDRSGLIVQANITATSMLGVERGRLHGVALASFLSEDDATSLHRHLRAVLSEGTRQGCDVWIRRRDGGGFPAHIESVIESEPPGSADQPGRCRVVVLDVTELRRAQDDARTQESRTRTLLDTAADAIVGTDRRGRIESLNPAAERLFGFSEAELRGASFAALVPNAVPEAPAAEMVIGDGEAVAVSKGGRRCPVEISVGEWWDRGARKLTVIVRDITARKQAERALQESEARLRQIADHIDDLFYVREANGVVSYSSPAYERIWGRPAGELAGNPDAWLDSVHSEDRDRVAAAWARMREGAVINELYRIRRPDGITRWVQSRGFPVQGPDGRLARVVGVVRDVTDARKMEEDIRQLQKMEAIGTLASGVAHNLRNVLQAVLGFIHVAHQKGSATPAGARALERARTTAKRGAVLTDQMMLFTRKQEAAMRPLCLDDVIRDGVDLIGPLVGDQIRIRLECGAPHAQVMADPVQVEQILLNLAANARDAMPRGGNLSLRTEQAFLDDAAASAHGVARGAHVKLVVRDDGVGMERETLSRIFEPFFTTKEVGRGTGLGLATVFALSRQFGACIDVESEPGLGTTVTLFFPMLWQPAAGDGAAAAAASEPTRPR